MFYDSDAELLNIIKNSGTAIILEKNTENLEKLFLNAIVIRPNTFKATGGKPVHGIAIGQIKEVIELSKSRSTAPRYYIFEQAETMNQNAQNAALKLFEEPKENYHYILQTTQPEALLPTIRSRAYIYARKSKNRLETPPEAEKDVFDTAKRLLVADTKGIIDISEELQKRKDTEKSPRRDFALKVLETTIELAEKSYFKTKNEAFTRKINGLIVAHQNIKGNGIIRLQIVANLV
ncbi:hypothetical protein IJ768_01345 [Candidatus Saccharibacteria bacterium]|nr:hypothetical protein [Candidatus Saccharibacteria bacterium]